MSTRMTLVQRGAHYFGVHDQPRTSIKTGPRSCVIVAEFNGRTTLMTYSEEHAIRGDFVKLTDRQRDALKDALDWPAVDERTTASLEELS